MKMSAAAVVILTAAPLFAGTGFGISGVDELTHFPEPRRTDNNMSVLIESIAEVEVVAGAEVACLTPDDYVAGAVALEGDPDWGMAVWGDDVLTTPDEVDGFRPDEPLRFLYWDPETDWEREVEFEIDGVGEGTYNANALIVIGMTVGVGGGDVAPPLQFSLAEPSPNPFNGASLLTFTLDRPAAVEFELLDSAGRFVAELAGGALPAGRHTVTLNASGLKSGVYFAVLRSAGRSRAVRMVVLK